MYFYFTFYVIFTTSQYNLLSRPVLFPIVPTCTLMVVKTSANYDLSPVYLFLTRALENFMSSLHLPRPTVGSREPNTPKAIAWLTKAQAFCSSKKICICTPGQQRKLPNATSARGGWIISNRNRTKKDDQVGGGSRERRAFGQGTVDPIPLTA